MGVHVAIKVDGIVRWALAFWLFIRRHRRSVSAFPHELKSAVVGDRLSTCTGYPVLYRKLTITFTFTFISHLGKTHNHRSRAGHTVEGANLAGSSRNTERSADPTGWASRLAPQSGSAVGIARCTGLDRVVFAYELLIRILIRILTSYLSPMTPSIAFCMGEATSWAWWIPKGRSGHGLATLAVHTLKAAGARAERYFR